MSEVQSDSRAKLIFDPEELDYDFGPEHPLQPQRIAALLDLLETCELWDSSNANSSLPLRTATSEELSLVHTSDYISAVQTLGAVGKVERLDSEHLQLAMKYGFAEGDTPVLPRMHEVSARIAGGSLAALHAVMGISDNGTIVPSDERPLHVFHPAGGLHHAWAERASGFCIYNDISVAIASVLRASEAKMLYIDFDTQHGCDTHAWDPLTHLSLTMRGIREQIKLAHQLAHSYCQGRWVALGGGGYDLYRVVPRAWSMVWAEMSEQTLPGELPDEWVNRWRPVWRRWKSKKQKNSR